ncbi:LysR family transcriptional regulator [Cohnella zeiphila]|uniref:LysR family transcriptional regulator n=1 Tax=Cohnella zeiphila TaxID=2761120 RepID=A0A7X0VWG1_9BACL|nr:LysR family transcriptional regulator [Cohnella zeiphila]MBB6733164.1 LysR family transcriptional regulator [Cohnella zeiphila]
MDIRQLRYFLAVAQEGQVTGAARLLHMEQPPLSRQLKQLEEELNVTLFDRSGKRFKLTPAGELLRRRAEGLLAQLGETVQEIRELDGGVRGELSIGSAVSCISLLPERIARFAEAYPLVTFKIREGDHFLLGELLERRKIELAITRLPFEASFDADKYAVRRLPSDPFVALLPTDWGPSPADQAIRLEELAQLPFLALKTEHTTAMHELIQGEFRRSGLAPRILCECSSVALILAFVSAGVGATILPKSVTSTLALTNIRMCAIEQAEFRSEVGLVWLKDRHLSRGALRFMETFAGEQI